MKFPTTDETAPGTVVTVGFETVAAGVRESLAKIDGLEVRAAASPERPLADVEVVACVVVAAADPDGDWRAAVEAVAAADCDPPVLLVTPGGDERLAVAAVRTGVDGYVDLAAADDRDEAVAGAVEEAVGVVREVEDRKARERERREYEQILETIPDSVLVVDADGRIVTTNDRGAELIGADREAVEGTPLEDLVAAGVFEAGAVEKYREAVRSLLSSEADTEFETYETTVTTPDGDTRRFESRIRLRPFEESFRGTVGVMRDITERTRREQALESLHRATREMMAAETPGAVARVGSDAAAEVLEFPLNAVYLYDEDADALVSAATTDAADELLAPPDTFESGESIAWEAFAADQARVFDDVSTSPSAHNPDTAVRSEFVLPLGEYGVLLVGSTRVGDFDESDVALAKALAANLQAAMAAADRERTLREREDELQRQNARLERFASAVSHDLRNPLNVAVGHLELLEAADEGSGLDQIRTALERMDDIIDDLLTLARHGETIRDPEPAPLAATARNAWDLVDTADATLRTDCEADVVADPGRLQQLFENLFRNAVEHGGPDVTVTVETTPDGFAVADDGPGIPPDERADVLASGYTTTSTGTGFGLAIVAEIAEAHGWGVTVTGSSAGGARFEFTDVGKR